MKRRKQAASAPTGQLADWDNPLEIEMANRAVVRIRRRIVRDPEGTAIGHRLDLLEFADCTRCSGGPGPLGGENRADNPGTWHGGKIAYEIERHGTKYAMHAGCDCVWGALWVWVGRQQGASARFYDRLPIDRVAPTPSEPAPEAAYAYEDPF